MTSVAFLMAILLHEAPCLETKPEFVTSWMAEVTKAVELDAKVSGAGVLVSPEVDAALLDSMRWYEARLQSHPKDGDCHFVPLPAAPGRLIVYKTVCNAMGPLQVNVTAFHAVQRGNEGALVGLGVDLTGTQAELRDPETGVRAGYGGLLRWKGLCKGTPATWVTAWGWGKCPPKRTVDREAVRRCELAVVILKQRGQAPEWKCGHEGRKIRDDHDVRMLKWARDKAGEQ